MTNSSDNGPDKPGHSSGADQTDVSDLCKTLGDLRVSNGTHNLDPNKELNNYFELTDRRYFNGHLAKHGVTVKFSNRLVKFWTRTVKTNSGYEIRVSHILMDEKSADFLQDLLLECMVNTRKTINRALGKQNQQSKKVDFIPEVIPDFDDPDEDPDKDPTAIKKSVKFEDQVLSEEELQNKIIEIENKSVVDDRLDELDPKPDIHDMFKRFDVKYFEGEMKKNDVQVLWSFNMPISAGITYPKRGECPIIIRLSHKILRGVPRRHTVETILHEMIHAWMMIKGLDIHDPSHGHGLQFHKVMNWLNQETGANITVEHNLLDSDGTVIKFN